MVQNKTKMILFMEQKILKLNSDEFVTMNPSMFAKYGCMPAVLYSEIKNLGGTYIGNTHSLVALTGNITSVRSMNAAIKMLIDDGYLSKSKKGVRTNEYILLK